MLCEQLHSRAHALMQALRVVTLVLASSSASAQAHAQEGSESGGTATQNSDPAHETDRNAPNPNSGNPSAQKQKRPIATVDVVRANLEPSYLAYPIPISGLTPLIFESNVVAHFFVNRPAWPFAFVLTPKIIVRMFKEYSAPVKTPSYMPRITGYFWFDRYVPDGPSFYGSIMLSHHSNGQAGAFFNKDGTINYDTGSFSTNYFEFTGYATGFTGAWFGWSALSLETHPGFGQSKELAGRYGLWRLHLATAVLSKLPFKGQVNLELTAILDKFTHTAKAAWVREVERFPISLRYTINIPGIDLGLYIGYYFGHDYYNIYFEHVVHTVQLGISGSVAPTLLDTTD